MQVGDKCKQRMPQVHCGKGGTEVSLLQNTPRRHVQKNEQHSPVLSNARSSPASRQPFFFVLSKPLPYNNSANVQFAIWTHPKIYAEDVFVVPAIVIPQSLETLQKVGVNVPEVLQSRTQQQQNKRRATGSLSPRRCNGNRFGHVFACYILRACFECVRAVVVAVATVSCDRCQWQELLSMLLLGRL